MNRLKDCFTYDTDKEAYVQELQNTLDKLEDLVLHADAKYPLWEYLTENSTDTLAYTIFNLISSGDTIDKESYKQFNEMIEEVS